MTEPAYPAEMIQLADTVREVPGPHDELVEMLLSCATEPEFPAALIADLRTARDDQRCDIADELRERVALQLRLLEPCN